MESLYQIVGISRQGFHQYYRRSLEQAQLEGQLTERVKDHRQTHHRMGARPLYVMMGTNEEDALLLEGMGRDKFEQMLMCNELFVQAIRIFHKTTYAGAFRFPNLVEGIQISQLNRIWVSDLTYYRLLDGWAYLTFILDLYSRRCIGYALSETLCTEQTTIPALKMALKTRGQHQYKHQLVFHSDGGGQYYDKEFLSMIEQYQIRSSMAEIVYENPHMERFHSTAKNDYLIPWKVNSISTLRKALPRFIYLYNQVRPHQSLNYRTPLAFEQFVQHIPIGQRPSVLFKKVT